MPRKKKGSSEPGAAAPSVTPPSSTPTTPPTPLEMGAPARDVDLEFPHQRRVRASAGSGKTHALTRRYLQFLLSDRIQYSALKNLLAITFTNKATYEMKGRILEWLAKLEFRADPGLEADIAEAVGLAHGDLPDKAGRALDEIFGNYLDFLVLTIDSFLTGLARGSALDLHIPPRAEIIIDSRSDIDFAIARLIDRVGTDPLLTRLLHSTVSSVLETNEELSWDIGGLLAGGVMELRKLSKAAASELSRDAAAAGCRADARERAQRHGRALMEMIDRAHLTFRGDAFRRHLAIFLERGDPAGLAGLTGVREGLNMSGLVYGKANVVTPDIESAWAEMRAALSDLADATAVAEVHPIVNLVSLVEAELVAMEQREGTVHLDRLPKLIRGFLSAGGGGCVPAAYLYWGERIWHYCLDEFQDTGQDQWAVLDPLVENALAQGGSLFYVGDPKQAIYRFRGGSCELFDSVPRRFPQIRLYDDLLDTNRRSRRVLVDFFNELFDRRNLEPWIGSALASSLADPTEAVERVSAVFRDAHQRSPVEGEAKPGGYVLIQERQFDAGVDKQTAMERVVTDIARTVLPDILGRHYAPGDIAFLVRKNDEAALVSRVILNERLPVASDVTLSLAASQVVGELVEFVRFLDSPVDDLAFVSFASGPAFQAASGIPRGTMQDFVRAWALQQPAPRRQPLYVMFRSRFSKAWEELIEPFFKAAGYLPLYDLLQQIGHRWRIPSRFESQQIFLYHLLEVVRDREAEPGGSSMRSFLDFWDRQRDDPSLQVPLVENTRAIRVLTVHKAKGLGFPVVILPFPYLINRPKEWVTENAGGELRVMRLHDWTRVLGRSVRRAAEEESRESLIDELNTFYVSVTRAMDELYIYLPQFADRRQWARKRPVPWNQPCERGWKLPKGGATPASPAPARRSFERLHDWRARLHRTSRSYFDECPTEHRAALRRGTGIHAAIAAVGEATPTSEPLTRLRSHPVIGPLIAPPPDVRHEDELPLIGEDGRLLRPDRVLFHGDVITVVDWKTGGRDIESHSAQVRAYCRLLRALHPSKQLHGVIVYVDEAVAIPVEPEGAEGGSAPLLPTPGPDA